jgi:hypothetical protein
MKIKKNIYTLIAIVLFCFTTWVYLIFDTWLSLMLIPISLILSFSFERSKEKIWLYVNFLLMFIYIGFLLFWPNYECNEFVLSTNDIEGNAYLAALELQGKAKRDMIIPDCNCSVINWHKTDNFRCYKF